MIEVKNLVKRYGNHTAVSDLSFTIEKGKIYGFLGPNGAGKSTTMNIMTGCLSATSGEVRIGGYDIFEEPQEAKRLIGYLPEIPPLYIDRTPREYLTFVARAKKVAEKDIPAEIASALEQTGTTHVGDRLIKNLSKGYRQRVGIAQALIGNPEVIILDEPTVGLDPLQIIEIRELIQRLGQEHTVILSSHILSEVQAVCHEVLIIVHGKMIACDTPENLEKTFASTAAISLRAAADPEQTRQILEEVEGISAIELEALDGKTDVHLESKREDDDGLCSDIFFAFSRAGKAILRLDMERPSLEDIFIRLAGEQETEKKGEDSK